MEQILQITAILTLLIGTFFSAVGVLGYIRMPDVFTRLHATGKVSVFGVVLLLITAAIHTSLSWGKAMVLILFLILSAPAISHAIGSAACRCGLKMKVGKTDEWDISADYQKDRLKH